ncbi:MAG TPA: alcohol dehydrogenase catalytic domain-containing protein [Streptosporangiaceae bacterium]|nr:alcohol dehydrogenase catalytic domain-containing protein [Streptosporangiaceae bacterium]
MRVARLHGAHDIRITDEPVPSPGPGESLVRVTATGICGSDLHWWDEGGIGDARLSRPLVLGHEGAGVIATGPRRGERVAIDPAIPCEACRQCRDGYRNLCPTVRFSGHGPTDGMLREFMAWPTHLLFPLPDGLSDADGAMLEPLGVALHAYDLGHVPFGGRCAVIGCGPIGLLLVQVARAAGAEFILAADLLAHRREAAAKLGADRVADPGSIPASERPAGDEAVISEPSWLRDLAGDGVDVAFEAAGTGGAVQLAMDVTRAGGRVVLAGIPGDDVTTFRASLARRKGLTIAMARRMNEVYPRAISLAARGRVDLAPVVSQRSPLSDAAEAFGAAARRTGLKVVIEPAGGS